MAVVNIFGVCLWLIVPSNHLLAQDELAEAQALLSAMSPEQRVGQLFLVEVSGDPLTNNHPIVDLIINYHIGGVALTADSGSFVTPENAPLQISDLSNNLQRLALLGDSSFLTETVTLGNEPSPTVQPVPDRVAIPLFVTLNPDIPPALTATMLQGFSLVPTEMGIGATWEPAFAQTVGTVLGQDLAGCG